MQEYERLSLFLLIPLSYLLYLSVAGWDHTVLGVSLGFNM